jgi:hypothetical protein
LGFLVCFLFCHVFGTHPFKEKDDNELSVVLAWSLTLFFLSAICIKADLAEDSGEEQALFGIALTVILATGPILILAQTAKAILEHLMSRSTSNNADEINHREEGDKLEDRQGQTSITLLKTTNKPSGSVMNEMTEADFNDIIGDDLYYEDSVNRNAGGVAFNVTTVDRGSQLRSRLEIREHQQSQVAGMPEPITYTCDVCFRAYQRKDIYLRHFTNGTCGKKNKLEPAKERHAARLVKRRPIASIEFKSLDDVRAIEFTDGVGVVEVSKVLQERELFATRI